MLREMVAATPVLNAVILTRVNHVRRFAKQNDSGEGPGFTIRHREKDHRLTEAEKRSIELLNRFFSNCGWEFDPRQRKALRRDSLPEFLAKSVRDSLALDSAPIETEMKRDIKLGMDGFYAVDGATIRLCTEDGYEGDDEVFALQVIQSRICMAYTSADLIYELRNPMSHVHSGGYGLSEVELLVRVVTGFLNAMAYNIKGFDDNAIPKGLLHLSGGYGKEDLLAFKTFWNAMVKGINNAWALPVLVSPDQESKASFERFGVEFNEMYFSKWMTFLVAIICALFGMSPEEINFESFSAARSSLSGTDTEEKLASSKDKGLVPLLSYYEGIFTDYIVSGFDEKYVFRWTGLDEEDRKAKEERQKIYCTINEMRAKDGEEMIKDEVMGNAPVNPSLMGLYMQQQQAKQQPEQDFGEPEKDPDERGKQDEREEPDGQSAGQSAGDGQEKKPDFGGSGGGDDFGKALESGFGMTVYRINV